MFVWLRYVKVKIEKCIKEHNNFANKVIFTWLIDGSVDWLINPLECFFGIKGM